MESFVCFISKDSNITKAHVRYLEKKIYEIALENKTTLELSNSNTPPGSKLPICDCDDMDEFCDHIIFVLKNLGIIDFTKINTISDHSRNNDNENKRNVNDVIFYLNVPGPKGVKSKEAKLIIKDGAYVLLQGSYIRKDGVKSFASHNYLRLRKKLEDEKFIVETNNNNFLILDRDVDFNSPSAAAAIVRNSSMNGRKEWRTKEKLTLDEYENNQ